MLEFQREDGLTTEPEDKYGGTGGRRLWIELGHVSIQRPVVLRKLGRFCGLGHMLLLLAFSRGKIVIAIHAQVYEGQTHQARLACMVFMESMVFVACKKISSRKEQDMLVACLLRI